MVATRWFRLQARAQVTLPEEPSDVLALGYVRVSKKKQAARSSPQGQRHEIGQYIRQRGWEPGEVFEDTLEGWRNDRPSYLRLREEVRYLRKQGRAVVIVAVNFDRTGRLAEEMLAFGRELDNLGVELHLVDDNGVLTGDG